MYSCDKAQVHYTENIHHTYEMKYNILHSNVNVYRVSLKEQQLLFTRFIVGISHNEIDYNIIIYQILASIFGM